MSAAAPGADDEAPLADRAEWSGSRDRFVLSMPGAAGLRARRLETLTVAAWALLLARTTRRDQVGFGIADAAGAQAFAIRVDGTVPARSWLEDVERCRMTAPRTTDPCTTVVEVDASLGGRFAAAALVLRLRPGPAPELVVEYDPGRYTEGRARLLAARMADLVADVAGLDAGRGGGTVAALGGHRGVSIGSRALPPATRPVVDTVLANGAAFPGEPALCTGRRTITYAELADRIASAAAALRTGGVGPGARVALLGRPVPQWVVAMLAAWRLDAVVVPLGPELPAPRVAELAAAARVTHAVARSLALPPGPGMWGSDRPLGDDGWRVMAAAGPAGLRVPGAVARDAAYIVTTSGSTGSPRAILGSGRGLTAFLDWEARLLGAGPGDRCPLLTPPHFDVAFRDILLPLTTGATLCLPDGDAAAPAAVLGWLARHAVTILHAVPSRAAHWASAGPDVLPDLRAVLFAGEPLASALVSRWRAVAPRAEFVNLYGPSETTLAKLFHVVGDEPGPVPVGRPMPGAAVRLVRDRDHTCAPGEVGEIVIDTPLRGHGYLPGPGATVMMPESHRPFPTGDVGVVNLAGLVEHLGRRDAQVKVHGVRVDLAEVDARIMARPGVLAAAAAVLPAPAPRLVAVVQLDRAAPQEPALGAARAAALRRELAAELPTAMVPLRIVVVPEIPATSTGKIDRRAVADLVAGTAPPPAPSADVSRDGTDEARPTLRRVAEIWSEVLDIDPPRGEDDFFDLGGDSLRLTEVQRLLIDRLGVDVGPLDLFGAPTLGELAAVVHSRLGDRSH
ncbi:non-ribosomal peptide synthetase [Dactylosporangium sp. CA-233914]|uniref:non-ribosomal peptide synthetase n=1 Tax=Dactylosporangium sp. CA-233914 TaxID=3239934 RepID=UPI003D92D39A